MLGVLKDPQGSLFTWHPALRGRGAKVKGIGGWASVVVRARGPPRLSLVSFQEMQQQTKSQVDNLIRINRVCAVYCFTSSRQVCPCTASTHLQYTTGSNRMEIKAAWGGARLGSSDDK